ncbi:hypothetical protein K432DRAFT_387240 [Lepidopterella palustris CBS 459.81]|uniref:Uncharacterized protein n=1 Tax=Lepidopterella palustris CBS 459.81 TaxID=1314670 RepID=A0A8E2DY63_9PEZI|nr:hypothetical protein K432DRAFT_387240 [Lepidopterella palustris CBS 459.81]
MPLVSPAHTAHDQSLSDLRAPRALRANMPREDSIGAFSEAPTYHSDIGLPPPSYRTYAASIRSMSSFGCIDGLRCPDGTERRPNLCDGALHKKSGMRQKIANLAGRVLTRDSGN